MVRILQLSAELADSIFEAQSRNLQRLTEATDAESKAFIEALEELERRRGYQLVDEALDAAALEIWMRGVVTQAASAGDDVVLSMPSSLPASTAGGPSFDALNALVSAAGEEDDRTRYRYLPHPGDVATALDQAGLDPAWSQLFRSIAERMEEAEHKLGSRLTRVQADAGHLLLSALKQEQRLIQSFGTDRLVQLFTDPRSLTRRDPPPQLGRRGVPEAALLKSIAAVRNA